MLNTKEYFNQHNATLAFNEIDDQVAATCSGGVVTSSGARPSADVELWENGPFAHGSVLSLDNSVVGDGISNLGSFNDKTSSIRIRTGRWAFYRDDRFRPTGRPLAVLGPGSYAYLPGDAPIPNDSISSLIRVG